LRSDSETEVISFENANFKRGHPDLLIFIQRKKQLPTAGGINLDLNLLEGAENDDPLDDKASTRLPNSLNGAGTVVDIKSILAGIASVKKHQNSISSDLKNLQQSNQHLWAEAIAARERHKRNEDTINRILKFLAGVFGTSTATKQSDPSGSRRSGSVVPIKAARLMIEDGRAGKDVTVPTPTWESDDDLEGLDLPVEMDDVHSIDPNGEFVELIQFPRANRDCRQVHGDRDSSGTSRTDHSICSMALTA
jgi:heat shock transcription factor